MTDKSIRSILHRCVRGGFILLLTAALALVPLVSADPAAGGAGESGKGEAFPDAGEGYVVAASNSRLELRVNEKETWFQVAEKTGRVWNSTPENYKDDEIAQNVSKLGMS